MPRMPVQSIAFWMLDQARGAPGVVNMTAAVALLTSQPPVQADLDAAATFLEQAGLATVGRVNAHASTFQATAAGRGTLGTAIAAIRAVPDSAVPGG